MNTWSYVILFGLLGVAGSFKLHFFLPELNGSEEKVAAQQKKYNFPGPRQVISGLKYDLSIDGNSVIFLQADKFNVRKKKIGFLRFGLMNEALFQNAVIDVYDHSLLSSNKGEPDPGTKVFNSAIGSVLLKDGFSLFHSKPVSGMFIEPVSLIFHGSQGDESRISADSASLRKEHKDIVFNGNVVVACGEKTLRTGSLRLYIEGDSRLTAKDFIVNSKGRTKKGTNLLSDIYLNAVAI